MCTTTTMAMAPQPTKRLRRRNLSVDLVWGLTMLVALSVMLNGSMHFRQKVEQMGEALVANATHAYPQLRRRALASSGSDSNEGYFDTSNDSNTHDESEDPATALPEGITPQALSEDESMSACLLLKDDNDILNEWIAYHYHTLKLRRLIVATDPGSMTTPADLLKKWRGQDMIIDLWGDKDYMPEEFQSTGLPPTEYIENITKFKDITYEEMMQINSHRYRQRVFLASCFQTIQKEGRTWAMHIDSDEFAVSNQLLRDENASTELSLAPIERPGSVLELLQQAVHQDPDIVSYPCISMPRILYGSVESKEEEWPSPIDGEFDRAKFETLRWRYHASPKARKKHGNPKVIVDVSQIPERLLSRTVVNSIHRPYLKYCPGHSDVKMTKPEKFPLIANHYLGSWERYSSRADSRRSWETYSAKAKLSAGTDEEVNNWLGGFISDVGLDRAIYLLGETYLSTHDTTQATAGMVATE